VGAAGVTLSLPRGWHALPLTFPRGLAADRDPVARVVVASGPVSFGDGCRLGSYSFPSNGAALVIMEWLRPTPGAFPYRPARFTASTLPVQAAPAVECFGGPAGSVEFNDRGRRFDAFLLLGRRAPSGLAGRARAVLNTLRVATSHG
jgi:hypothetical protein